MLIDASLTLFVELEEGPLRRISPLHPALMALQYPLLFSYGDKGFYVGMRYVGPDDVLPGGQVSGRATCTS
jgi:hypothetical protein